MIQLYQASQIVKIAMPGWKPTMDKTNTYDGGRKDRSYLDYEGIAHIPNTSSAIGGHNPYSNILKNLNRKFNNLQRSIYNCFSSKTVLSNDTQSKAGV